MGFNLIAIEGWWHYVEPKYYAVGVYSSPYIAKLRNIVNWCKEVGLEIIYQCRIDYGEDHSFDGWATFDYVMMDAGYVYPYWTSSNPNLTPQWATGGEERYGNMLKYLAQQFPDIIINPEKFPYHQTGISDYQAENWNDNVFPYLKQKIREGGNNRPVVFVPVHQHAKNIFNLNHWYGDDVILGLGHFTPWEVVDFGEWDYDTTDIDFELQNVAILRANFPDITILSIEYGGLQIPASQSRLDCLEYHLNKLMALEVGWGYWCISWLNGGLDTILLGQAAPTNTFNFEEGILDLLTEYMLEIPEPEPEAPTQDIITVSVNDVVDGDTFHTYEGYTIRLADINAPEIGQPGYLSSVEYLELLIENKTLTLDIDSKTGTDQYGRYVCLVYIEYNSTHWLNVNQALIEQGYAILNNYSNNEFEPANWELYSQINGIPEFQSLTVPLSVLTITTIFTVLYKRKMNKQR